MRRWRSVARRGGSTAVVAAVLEALLTGAAAQGLAQPDVAVPAGRLQGSVVAAQTNLPIDDAIVSIVVAGGGILPANRASAFWHTSRSTRTDANGVYRFDGLAPGRYQLHIRRIGYRSADVDIDLGGAMSLQVSVGLSILPIVLEPLTVRAVAFAPAATPFRSAWDSVARARLITESQRRHRFLATDARSLTGADLTEAVTLGETDLFRALQRMPGVSTRDEFTAELWTRGGRWSDTRVTYDGLPLFSPLHAGGTIGGVPPDIVGSAVFHPGVRPAALGEGAAAALELTSKPALQPGFHGAAELSTISARTILEHGGDGAGPRWVLGARRSYIDLVTKLLGQLQQDSMIPIPYAFIDLSGRVDVPLGSSSAIELSGLWSEDRLGGGVPNLLFGNRGRWGNALVRATLVAPLRGLATRHTIGFSGQRMLVRSCSDASCDLDAHFIYPLDTRSSLSYVIAAGVFVPIRGDRWSAGYELVSQRLRFAGKGPSAYAGEVSNTWPSYRGAVDIVSLWGERRVRITPRLMLQSGLRVEAGTPVAGQPSPRLAPRVQVRYAGSRDGLAFSAGFGRSFQYSQTIGPMGMSFGPELHLSDVWILAGDTTPTIRSDIASAGIEYWLPAGWMAAFNLYRRNENGVAVPNPTPGPRYPADASHLFVVGSATSQGAELSIRKLTGRWTGSASVTVSRSKISARGYVFGSPRYYRYPAPNDRGTVFHATGLFAVSPNLRLGGAATVAGKAAFTRFVYYTACHGDVGPDCPTSDVSPGDPYAEAPGAARARGVAALDLLADWHRSYRGWTIGAYVQLRNALRATRAVSYTGSLNRCAATEAPNRVQVRPGICDVYARGLPRLPLAGVRVSF